MSKMADRVDPSVARELDKLKKAELIDIIINNKLPEGTNNDVLNKYLKKYRAFNHNNSENNNISESDPCDEVKCDKKECVKTYYSLKNSVSEKVLMENNIQLLYQRISDLEHIIALLKSKDENGKNKTISDVPSTVVNSDNHQQKSSETAKTSQSNKTTSKANLNQIGETGSWQTVSYKNNKQPLRNKSQDVQKSPDKNQHIFTAEEVSNAIRSSEIRNKQYKYTTSHRKPIIGSNKNISSVKAVPKLGYLHVYRLNPSTTPQELCNFLSQTAAHIHFKCDSLFKNEKTCSMMVTFPINHVREVYNPDIWPDGALVNRFIFKGRNFPHQASESPNMPN